MISRWNESRISSAMRIAAYMCGPRGGGLEEPAEEVVGAGWVG